MAGVHIQSLSARLFESHAAQSDGCVDEFCLQERQSRLDLMLAIMAPQIGNLE